MEELLPRIWERFLHVGERVLDALNEGVDYQQLQRQVQEDLNGLGRDIMRAVIEASDQRLRARVSERPGWVVVQRGKEKELLTPFGPMTYRRTYFKHKVTKEHRYLVDEAMGFTPHQRIDVGLKAQLVEESTVQSYRASGQWSYQGSWRVSGQTVMQASRDVKITGVGAPKGSPQKRRVPYLFIQADEDHVANQAGPRWQPRLVTVYEGIEGPPQRRRLRNARRFGGLYRGRQSQQLYEDVWKYLDETYDLEHVTGILVSGDGASWIRGLCEYIPGSVFILDRFHAQKYVLAATGDDAELYRMLWSALRSADRPRMRKTLNEAMQRAETSAHRKRIEETRRYFERQWDGVKAWQSFEAIWPGCSVEGDVSHVYAARMSSRPMAWSKRGVDQMSRMRVMRANGESIRALYLSQHRRGLNPVRIAQAQLRDVRRALRKNRDLAQAVLNNLPALLSSRNQLQRTLRTIANL